MKKLTFTGLAALMVVALLVVGCGGNDSGGTAPPGKVSAQQILEESNTRMQEVSSMKAVGNYKASMGEAVGAEQMDFSFEMEIDTSNPESPEAFMVMRGMGESTEVFLSGGYAYANIPGQGWVKAPAGDADSFNQATPAEIAKFADDAEDLKILAEDGNSYEISFIIGEKYLRDQMAGETGLEDLGPEVEKMMSEMLKSMKMSAVFIISKDTMFIEVARINMDVEDMPMLGSMSLVMELEFSEFNQPVSVSLPPEAAAAVETSEFPDTIPGFPGFGF